MASPPLTCANASTRRLHEIQVTVDGEAKQALVPLTHVVIGPEQSAMCLLIGSDVALQSTQPPDLFEVSRIFLTT